MASKNTVVILHPPYSPDLTPCDFFLLPKNEAPLKRLHFDTIEDIQAKSLHASNANVCQLPAWNDKEKYAGITVSMPNVTILKETVVTISYAKQF